MNFNHILIISVCIIVSAQSINSADKGHDVEHEGDHTDHEFDTPHDESHHEDPHHEDPHHEDSHREDTHHEDPLHEDQQNYGDLHPDDSYEPREFDYDPHQTDADYDEDVLTGTAHHTKRSKIQTKTEIDGLFQIADKNNDSKLEKDELKLYILNNLKKLHNESTEEEFLKVDINVDKKVSLDEYLLYHHDKTSAALDNLTKSDNSTKMGYLLKRVHHEKVRFKAADTDGDGFLNIHEYILMKYPIFFPHMAHTIVHEYITDLDNNVDGMIDKEEYLNHFHVDDPNNKTHEEASLKKHQADFEMYDKDKNGKIDPEEYYAIMKPGYDEPARVEMEHLFQETDADKDGVITLAEVEKHSHLWLGGEPLEEDDDDYRHYDDEL